MKIPYDKLPEALCQFVEVILKMKKVHDLFKEHNINGKIVLPIVFKDDGINKSILKIISKKIEEIPQ